MNLLIMSLLHFCKEPDKKNKLMQKKKIDGVGKRSKLEKKIQEINFNLNSKYMDYEDKGKKL